MKLIRRVNNQTDSFRFKVRDLLIKLAGMLKDNEQKE